MIMLGNINDQDTHNIEMKDSGISWLGEIPAKWSVQSLKHLASISTGNRDTIEKDPNGAFPFFVRSEKVERIASYSYDGEAVLIPGDGNVGSIFHHYIGKYDCHQRVYNITNFTNVCGRFIYYYMSACFKYEVDKGTAKSTVDSLRLPMLMNFPVCFGSLDEQKKIVSILDNKCHVIDNIVRQQSQILTNLKDLKQSIITEVVTKGLDHCVTFKDSGIPWIGAIPKSWDIIKLKHLVSVSNKKTSTYSSYIGLENVESWSGRYVSTESCSAEQDLIAIHQGDLCFSKLRPYLAKAIISPFDGACSSEFIVISHFDGDIRYLKYLMLTPNFIEKVNSSTYGTKMPRANWDYIGSIYVPKVPLDEQICIANYLDVVSNKIDMAIDEIKQSMELMLNYKQSIIFEFVTGKKVFKSEGSLC